MSIRRAKPRKIGLPESDSEPESTTPIIKTASPKPSTSATTATPGDESTPIPTFTKRKKAAPRTPKLSLSLDEGNNDEEEPPVFVKKPLRKKPISTNSSQSLHKAALENAAAGPVPKKPPPMRIAMPDRPSLLSSRTDEDRPSYSKEYLAELKASTPVAKPEIYDAENMDKLGAVDSEGDTPMAEQPTITAIPDEAEIRRLKLARERKKAGEDYIALDDNSDEDWGRKKKKDSRLVRPEILDDEDPELQQYVNDDRLGLSSKTRKRQAKLKRLEIAAQIDEAEENMFDHVNGDSDTDGSSSSDDELLGWERDQILKATGGKSAPALETIAKSSRTFTKIEDRLRYTPPNVRPLPSINLALGRLKGLLRNMEEDRKKTLAKIEDVKKERQDILEREEQVKKGLEESAREYEKLEKELKEMGLGVPAGTGFEGVGTRSGTMTPLEGRGLESIGGTPVR
ncbi:hypothetical protein BJ508DRAFT_410916 [Ascobolus immersus RN42]|uniref:Uncharacterized protein n=1 Tax=Ascobolus immersus RN42 TaxID=1160509 RepID=A0A3N4IKQ2_ASCIM|nr:hypothetical protein BJ508DRAFT_410916 [Ascobolus immersus RN42]